MVQNLYSTYTQHIIHHLSKKQSDVDKNIKSRCKHKIIKRLQLQLKLNISASHKLDKIEEKMLKIRNRNQNRSVHSDRHFC